MSFLDDFEFAAATVQGRDHRRAGRNNQDAFALRKTDEGLVAVVADGCGSAPHSEVGAKIGIQALTLSLAHSSGLPASSALLAAREDVTRIMRLIASWTTTNRLNNQFVRDHFLFTLVGMVLNEDVAAFFYFGDGMAVVNGERFVWHSPNNTPGYLGYDLINDTTFEGSRNFVRPVTWNTKDLDSFVIATDGAERLFELDKTSYPGKQELIGPIDRLWEDDRYFQNPDALRRHLTLVNRDGVRAGGYEGESIEHFRGLLPDDTTVIVGRRKRG